MSGPGNGFASGRTSDRGNSAGVAVKYNLKLRDYTVRNGRSASLRLQASVLLWSLAGCGRAGAPPQQPSVDDLAHEYVVLAVALGERDPDALDFYYGPKERVAEVPRSPHQPPLT